MSSIALLVLTHALALRSANLAGNTLLRDGTILVLREGRIEAASPRFAPFLRDLIGRASDEGYRAIAPSLQEGGRRELVFSSRRLSGDGQNEGFIMLSARPLGVHEPLTGSQVVELFGLTQTEARVTIKLASGLPLPEIAQAHNVHVGTLRAQLRSIYSKVGVAKQPELVAAIWRTASL